MPIPLSNRQAESGVWKKELEIAQGSIVEVSGRAACGKTTLLSFIYGLRFDYEGEIFLNGTNICSMREPDWSSLRTKSMSIVFQDLRLFDFLTGMENILVKGALASAPDEREIAKMAEALGIRDALDRRVRELSTGEKQRIAIIRSLVSKFDLLLLDEHTSHLDTFHAEKANELILARARALSSGIICATLDSGNAFPYTKRLSI